MISTTFHDTFTRDEVRAAVAGNTPLRREGRAQEVADLVAYLASPASSFITGAEAYRERGQERVYLHRLKTDLEHEMTLFDGAVNRSERRLAAVRLLVDVSRDPDRAAADPDGFITALEKAGWVSFPLIGRYVYRELQTTGNLALVRSGALREALADHYGLIEFHERLGLDRSILSEFDRQIDGLIELEQMIALESEQQRILTPAEAVDMARRFQSRPEAVALLPEVAQYHLFNRRVSEAAAQRTQRLLALIEALLKDTS